MATGGMSLQEQFINFSKFGDTKSDGKTITLTQSDKWMKQAKVIDGKKITTTDTGICFGKLKSKTINFNDFVKFVEDIAREKKVPADNLKDMLQNCGLPGTTNTTTTSKVGGVDRMTDTKLYTGAHKERFDDSGKGKGRDGRDDLHENTGYVGGYKGKDTFDNPKN